MLTRDAKGVSIWKEETIHLWRTRGKAAVGTDTEEAKVF
jgi:hypothetical protein